MQTNEKQLETAILFITYKRLDTTKQVFEAIKTAKPQRLYISSNIGKNDEEITKVLEVRKYLEENIDWECVVSKLYRVEHLSAKLSISGAIDWFFENEEMGIILEDDCLPSQSFFWFCEELLERYKDDMRVWHIAGNNFHFGWKRDEDYSYYFGGIYGSVWGWASWRSRWNHYDVEMKNYDEIKAKKYLENCYDGSEAVKSRIGEFEHIKKGLDTWDFQCVYTRWTNSGLTIVPSLNLVKNLGFGEDATHTMNVNDKRAKMIAYDIDLNLKHPSFIIRDFISENKFYNDFGKPSFLSRCKQIIKKLLGK